MYWTECGLMEFLIFDFESHSNIFKKLMKTNVGVGYGSTRNINLSFLNARFFVRLFITSP